MLEIAFTLQGRLNRLQFFLGALALGVAYVVGLGAIALGGVAAATKHDWTVVGLLVLAVLPLAVAVLWCSLSLHVRRIRDMGWDPTIVIASWFIGQVADKLILAALLPRLVMRGVWHSTYLGFAADITLSLVILLWPSHDQAPDDDARYLQPGPPRWAESGRLAPAATPIPADRLARVTGRREFGRRGA